MYHHLGPKKPALLEISLLCRLCIGLLSISGSRAFRKSDSSLAGSREWDIVGPQSDIHCISDGPWNKCKILICDPATPIVIVSKQVCSLFVSTLNKKKSYHPC
jgi:hypothetical protein